MKPGLSSVARSAGGVSAGLAIVPALYFPIAHALLALVFLRRRLRVPLRDAEHRTF
jgi:hypothetical protein